MKETEPKEGSRERRKREKTDAEAARAASDDPFADMDLAGLYETEKGQAKAERLKKEALAYDVPATLEAVKEARGENIYKVRFIEQLKAMSGETEYDDGDYEKWAALTKREQKNRSDQAASRALSFDPHDTVDEDPLEVNFDPEHVAKLVKKHSRFDELMQTRGVREAMEGYESIEQATAYPKDLYNIVRALEKAQRKTPKPTTPPTGSPTAALSPGGVTVPGRTRGLFPRVIKRRSGAVATSPDAGPPEAAQELT